MDQTDKKPPAGKPGRPPSMLGDVTTVNLRLTVAQKAKLKQLGGASWVRKMIEKAATAS